MPSAKPTGEPVATAEPTVTPSAKPSEKPVATETATPSVKPTGEPVATAEPAATPSVKPTEEPVTTATATPSVKPTREPVSMPTGTPSINPTATPICGCMNGGPCIGPNGTCVCINCPYRDKVGKPTATTTTSSSSSYQKVKPKVYYTATKVGKRLKLWKVTQWVKDGKIKTSKKWKSICFFDRKKGKIQWNGYKRKTIKTCQFTNKKHWLVGITTKGKLKLYPSGKQTKNPKTMKGVYVAIKCNSNGLATAGVKKNGKVVKLKY